MNFIVDKDWLLKNLQTSNVRIIDCRFSLANPEKGAQEYGKNHIPGALYFDLEKDLSGQVKNHGGRHPLPKIEEFVAKLEQAGIDENSIVIAYDGGEGAFAGRLWWMLQYLGHQKAYVLNGGFKEWAENHYPLSEAIPIFKPTTFKPNYNLDIIATVEDVKAVVSGQAADTILVDSREERRYLGLEEPIDKKAGRIPGAINKPWFEGLQDSHYKSSEEQQKRFSDLNLDKQVIVYCGSGVTATPNFLALKEAGFHKVKLYLGSFSDWISYEENNIE